jgi:PAS domain S-box-containing protein
MTNPGAGDALPWSEHRYQTLLSAIAQIVWTTDARGKMTEDQPGWRAYTGGTNQEIQNAGWLTAIHPDSRPQSTAAWDQAMARALPYETEWYIRRKDGQYRRFSIHAVPVCDKGSVVREWICCGIDITDQRRCDEKLLRQARETQILKNLGDTLQACNSREEAYPFIALAATELFPGATGALAVPITGTRDLFETATEWGGETRLGEAAWMKPDFAMEDCWALRRGVMHQPESGTTCHHFRSDAVKADACMPLSVRGEVSGMVSVHLAEGHSLDADRRAALSTFGNAVALGLSTLQLRESLQNQTPVRRRAPSID